MKYAILITFLFLNTVSMAISQENDSVIYPDSKVNGEAHTNQNVPFFSQRDVEAIILEGKKALFVERNYQKARNFFEVALGVEVTNAIACYLLGVIELEEGNPEAGKARFRQAHELVNAQRTSQFKFDPVASPFNSGILPPQTQSEGGEINGNNFSPSNYIPQERPQRALPLENQWISVNGTPMNIGQGEAVSDSDGSYLPALVKFPSQYSVHIYSKDGWNISLKEETTPTSGQATTRGYLYRRDDVQTLRKWRENGATVYSFPPNSTYRIKVEPKHKNRTSLYMVTLVAVTVAGWLVIR